MLPAEVTAEEVRTEIQQPGECTWGGGAALHSASLPHPFTISMSACRFTPLHMRVGWGTPKAARHCVARGAAHNLRSGDI
eukprot:2465226-Amphidinium_carterae.1